MTVDTLFLGGTSIDIIQNRQKGRDALTFSTSIGGSITNSCIIAAKLGLKIGLLSKIGKDTLGDYAIGFLKSLKIDTSGIIQDLSIRTPLAIAKIDKSGIAKYAFYKNSPKDSVVPIKHAPEYLLNTCKVFHIGSSYSYQKNTFEETLKFVKCLKKRNVFIVYDPNIRPVGLMGNISVKNKVLKLLKLADLVKLSEIDLEYLTGHKSPEKGLSKLEKSVHCPIVLTLGPKGSIYYHLNRVGCLKQPTRFIKIPAFKVKVADTIGAGDAFTAGLIYKFIKQGKTRFFSNIKSNMIFASAVSAIICTKKGSHEALKNTQQVKLFLSNRTS
ncbi:MAG: PfkB family carbohydrate kinase [Candidatus Omnitrophica bacterium]|nr:PfkB family carbohydrate kinase [Candidatus Omnitrophota bacterium]